MRFDINLATRTYVDTRALRLALILALLLVAGFTLLNLRSFSSNLGERKRLASDIAALDARFKASAPDVSEKDFQVLMKRISFSNGIIRKKTANWLLLLDSVENVTPEGVSLSQIEPDQKNGGVKLGGMARSFKNIRQMVERMESDRRFSDVYLVSQSEVSVGENRKATTFEISCKVGF